MLLMLDVLNIGTYPTSITSNIYCPSLIE